VRVPLPAPRAASELKLDRVGVETQSRNGEVGDLANGYESAREVSA
jgi:hypothetical protein